jgi:hypothetical protein
MSLTVPESSEAYLAARGVTSCPLAPRLCCRPHVGKHRDVLSRGLLTVLLSPSLGFTKRRTSHPDVHAGEECAEQRHHHDGNDEFHSEHAACAMVPATLWTRLAAESTFVDVWSGVSILPSSLPFLIIHFCLGP